MEGAERVHFDESFPGNVVIVVFTRFLEVP